jgi:hypothetical protein
MGARKLANFGKPFRVRHLAQGARVPVYLSYPAEKAAAEHLGHVMPRQGAPPALHRIVRSREASMAQ